MNILRTKNLTMKFKDFYAINDVSLDVKPNQIYGLVGKNGAGKTTFMKCVLGLLPDSKGDIELFGSKDLKKGRRNIGALIEEPGFFKNMTGYQNLLYYSKAYGINDSQEILRLLELMKLYDAKDKKYKSYSLGMKQRLGVALALIGDPELLILDEPINGIDPEGIVEIRNLFKSLVRDQGKTIIISSHILSELENISDTIAIIDKGKLVDIIEKDDDRRSSENQIIRLKTDNDEKAASVLLNKKIDFTRDGGLIVKDAIKTSNLLRLMYENEIEIVEFERKKESLEEYFLEKVEVK